MEDLFDKLTDYVAYAHLWHKLNKTQTDDELNYLMLRMADIEEEISIHYGLPLTLEYSDIFQELGIKDDFKLADIPICIEKLEQAAEDYFDRPVLTDLQLLKQAQKKQLEIDFVLPELTLRLRPYTYYTFCYYFLFLKKKTTPKLYLRELELVEKNNLVKKLQELVNLPNCKETREYLTAKMAGLSYLDIYLDNYEDYYNNQPQSRRDGIDF
jgi:hypothetical protein